MPTEEKQLIKKMEFSQRYVGLGEPCQVIVIDPTDYKNKILIFTNSKERPDMETIVFKDLRFKDFLSKAKADKRIVQLFPKLIDEVIGGIMSLKDALDESGIIVELKSVNWSVYIFSKDSSTPTDQIANHFFQSLTRSVREMERKKQSKKIETTVDNLKRDAEAIPETVQLRNKILENTSRLENQIEDLNKKVEEEVIALREMVGTSKDYLGWKVFSTDVKHLKETHVAKGEFNSEIKRLDEKIENKTEALNTRIEDLKAIKFWSKRTLLEIALTIWGAIVTLYVAGILKF